MRSLSLWGLSRFGFNILKITGDLQVLRVCINREGPQNDTVHPKFPTSSYLRQNAILGPFFQKVLIYVLVVEYNSMQELIIPTDSG